MKSVVPVVCVLLFLSALGFAQANEEHVAGLVTKIDEGSFNLTTKTGEVKTVIAGPSTKYAKGEAAATWKELKVGDRVVVHAAPGNTLYATKVIIDAPTKKYPLQGEVVSKRVISGEITVHNRDIPGFMPAMTMPYRVQDPAAVQAVQPGDKIVAEVVVGEEQSGYWLDNVRITDQTGRAQARAQAAAHRLMPGERAPDLPLINQDGRTIHFADFAGKAVLVTFIYTRCIMPDYCPRLSTQFARIQAELKKSPEDYSKTHLLTITFDPTHDDPPTLRKYGLVYLDGDESGFSHWDFTTTSPSDLSRLAQAFGLEFEPRQYEIYHTTSIVLIAPDGTVAKFWSADWTRAELLGDLQRAASGTVQTGRR